MTNKKLTIEQAQDILNKFYRVPENDYALFPYYMHGVWIMQYNRNNNNNESDFHALEERFLYYSGDIPQLYIEDGKHCIGWATRYLEVHYIGRNIRYFEGFHLNYATRLFWERDIQNMTTKEFIKFCNKEFAAIVD